MTTELISLDKLGDIKNRELKWSQEEKTWIEKRNLKTTRDRWAYFIGERLIYDWEKNGIRRRHHEAMDMLKQRLGN